MRSYQLQIDQLAHPEKIISSSGRKGILTAVQDLLFAQLQNHKHEVPLFIYIFMKLSRYKIKGKKKDAADDTSNDWKARGKW